MRKFILNVPLDDLSIADIVKEIESGKRFFQVFINVHKINHFNSNTELNKLIDYKETIFSPDGTPIKWYAKFKGFHTKQRFGGVDVIEEFSRLSETKDYSLYLLGSTEETLSKCTDSLKKSYPKLKISGSQHGYFDDESKVIEEIRNSGANVLFIALPSPRKEVFGYQVFDKVPELKYVAGVGGAFAIFSGDSKRAPGFIQRLGLEWIYRTILEPRRLFMRYWKDGKAFLRLIIKDVYKT